MNMLSILLINIIILLSPLMFYLFYSMYIDNIDKEQNYAFLDFAIVSSVYLLITNYQNNPVPDFIMLLNIPLIIAMMKKRSFISIVVSIILVIFYYSLGEQIISIILQYIIIYSIYLLYVNKKISFNHFFVFFLIIQSIFLILNNYVGIGISLIKTVFNIIIFSTTSYVTLYLFQKCELITKLHTNIKELEKDKSFRESLFKITHEIKNPIAVCKSYLDMYDENNKKHQKYIPIIKEEIEKILLLLQDFLSMNKIKIQKDLLDINLLLEDVILQFESVLSDNNIDFKYNISQDEVIIDGDYNRLNQVLINMIKNSQEAVDYNKKPFIFLDYKIEKNKFKIIIEDNGVGIDKSDIERIKEPFYTTKKNGTGLGVSLSHEIIAAHNGTIEYYSESNVGTKVIITLPITKIFN